MSDVCVVTGGGSGMGLSAAPQMPKDKIIIVSGRAMHRSALLNMGKKESVCAL